MKQLFIMALLGAAIIVGAAEKNLFPAKFYIYGKPNDNSTTVIQKDGQIDCTVKNGKDSKTALAGIVGTAIFPKHLTGSFTFGAESKAEKVEGNPHANYCVYLDFFFADGTKLYGRQVAFTAGTHDWEKKTFTVKVDKPVKHIACYILFRNMTGKASFRNFFVYNK